MTQDPTLDPATAAVRPGEELDWARLDAHLKQVLPDLDGTPQVSQFTAGNSNLTYRARYANADLVIRRPPFGTKAKSAHSMIREYRVMSALRPVYASVPEALYYSDDESIIGAEFYVMRRVDGVVVHQSLPAEWGYTPADTRRLCERFWRKLVELHKVDYDAAGLGEFGKPQGYCTRQIHGWNKRYAKAMTADVDEFADVQAWLVANIPVDNGHYSVLHGDYRIDNVILDKSDPSTVAAVVDWEICALGDPLMDLGNALAYWCEASDPAPLKALKMQPSDADGMLTRDEILEFYAKESGLDTSDFTFYLVYGYFRNAVILQQIYYRYFHGQTQDARFKTFGHAVMALGMHCRTLIERA